MHSTFNKFASAAGIFAAGFAMLISNWHPYCGVAAMLLGLGYGVYIPLSLPVAKAIIPPMFGLVVWVVIVAAIVAWVAPSVRERLFPTSTISSNARTPSSPPPESKSQAAQEALPPRTVIPNQPEPQPKTAPPQRKSNLPDTATNTVVLADEIAKRLQGTQKQSMGNLCERAQGLADEIARFLASYGWPNNPPKGDSTMQSGWLLSLSGTFRHEYLPQVKQIRDEFASLHYIEPRLDEFLKGQQEMEDSSHRYQMPPQLTRVFPQQIEEVVGELRTLANRASPTSQREPEELEFKEARANCIATPALFQILVSITTKKMVTHGYIFVQFAGNPTSMATDYHGGRLVSHPDEVVNENLAALLKTDKQIKYAIEIGSDPLMPDSQVHVCAAGKEEFHVSKVMLF